LGIDKIVENILSRLGDLKVAFIVGDYAHGKDSGTIELVLVGVLDQVYLNKLVTKAKRMIRRNIITSVLTEHEFEQNSARFNTALLIWRNVS
jgi:hypothetical protein